MQSDSSYSRTYLTHLNNPCEALHSPETDPDKLAEIQARNEQLRQRGLNRAQRRHTQDLSRSASSSARTIAAPPSFVAAIAQTMTAQADEDVFGPPEDSSEDEPATTASKAVAAQLYLPTPDGTQLTAPNILKRPARTEGSRKSKRHKHNRMEDSTTTTTGNGKQNSPILQLSQNESQDWLSQSSQSKKRTKVYGGRSRVAAKSMDIPSSQDSPQKERASKTLNTLESPKKTPKQRQGKKFTDLKRSESPVVPPQRSGLELFDEDDDKENDTKHSIENESKDESKNFLLLDKERHRRSDSLSSGSSLSSADSFASLQLDKSTKARLMAERAGQDLDPDSVPHTHLLCPVCKRVTSKEGLKALRNLSKLPTKKLQTFCYDHRIRDAKAAWKTAEYPQLDFDTLASSKRVQEFIRDLIPLVQRKKPSYYLNKLDEATAQAKGNQGAVKRYFDAQAVMLIHNGYYGPKGARILNRAIAEEPKIIKTISKECERDKTLRLANPSRLIDTVLLPELLVQLVIDDMMLAPGIDGQEQARKILEDSVELGLLLCGDDDEVDLDGGEDNLSLD